MPRTVHACSDSARKDVMDVETPAYRCMDAHVHKNTENCLLHVLARKKITMREEIMPTELVKASTTAKSLGV